MSKRYNPNAPAPSQQPAYPAIASAPAPAPAAPASNIIRKVSFGTLAPKKSDAKTAYPIAPDPAGQLAILAARICQRDEEIKALESLFETDKKDLRCLVTPFYFTNSHGKHEVASSVSVPSPSGEVLVVFQNRYKQMPDETSVLPILGDTAGQWFKQAFELKIDGDKLPEDKAQLIIDELNALLLRHQCDDALSVKQHVKPVPEFHAKRHLVLDVEQNLALEEACPLVVVVKPAKGRK